MVQAIRPLNARYLTVLDAEKHAVLAYDVHKAPTRVVSIENTNSGTVIPLEELQRLHACEWSELPYVGARTGLSMSFVWHYQMSKRPRRGLLVLLR